MVMRDIVKVPHHYIVPLNIVMKWAPLKSWMASMSTGKASDWVNQEHGFNFSDPHTLGTGFQAIWYIFHNSAFTQYSQKDCY